MNKRFVDNKWVIINEYGDIINKNPNKEELNMVYEYTCLICGHQWNSRTENFPHCCANTFCQSRKWNANPKCIEKMNKKFTDGKWIIVDNKGNVLDKRSEEYMYLCEHKCQICGYQWNSSKNNIPLHCANPLCHSLRWTDNYDDKRIESIKILNKKTNIYQENYRRKMGSFPMEDYPDCADYLGIFIGQRKIAKVVLPIILGEIIREMSLDNPGFDIICKNDKYGNIKVDVKSKRLIDNKWDIPVLYNNITDYFLCIAFNNESNGEKLKVLHIWLFHKFDMIRTQQIGSRYIMDKFCKRNYLKLSNGSKRIIELSKYDYINDPKVKIELDKIVLE